MTVAVSGESITFADSSVQTTAATGFGFKNRIINGCLNVDQRNNGAAQTITAAAALAYTVDRWYAYCTGANVTGQQIAGTYASSQYRYQFTGAASVTAIGFGHRIEAKNSYDLANSTATLSCYIANSLLTTVTWTAYYATTTADTFGSLASPTVTSIATGTFTVTSTRARYTANISIPSAATTGIQIVLTVGAQTSGTWVVDSIQLEKGSTATSFDYRPYGTELALCQRYYQQLGSAVGMASSASLFTAATQFFVPMRTSPTLSASAAMSVTDTNTADYTQSSAQVSIVSGTRINNLGVNYSCSNFSGMTVSKLHITIPTAYSNGIILASAEL